MIIKTKVENKEWGFLEKFWNYTRGSKRLVKSLTTVTKDGELGRSYVVRGGKFVPLEVIDKEVGIDRYIKAKKPFYSKLRGNFIVLLKVRVDILTGEYYRDTSGYELYVVNGDTSNIVDGELPFKRVRNVPKEFDGLLEEPMRLLAESRGDREKFLRSRLREGVTD